MAPWLGCGDIQPNWRRTGQTGPSRPGPESRKPGPPADTVAKAPATTRPAEPAAPPTAIDDEPTSPYFQLVLFSEPASPTAPPNFVHIQLQHAPAPSVADVLRRLYVPIGHHGQDRYVLLYATEVEWRAAGDFTRLFDVVPSVDLPDPLANEPSKAFQQAIAVLMASSRPGSVDQEALAGVAAAMERIAAAEQAVPILRWAAAMLAGDIHANTTFDFNRAEQVFIAAQSQAPAGSVEAMNTLYARATAHLANGRKDRAQPLFTTVVSQLTAFRRSEVYHRCRRGLEKLQGQ
ncbi:MAG: hypothetical protein JXA69_11385 [Phycisphaerae bacterium]|nr:hypothetical protein [Phycisphaerae bacterium]